MSEISLRYMKAVWDKKIFLFNEKIFANQACLLIEYTQSYCFYKVVIEYFNENAKSIPDIEYWVHLLNVTANDLIIKWCKVFGTDDNELHWKKTSSSEHYEKTVRDLILKNFAGDIEQWREYRKSVCDFRNTYSAHRNIENYREFPELLPSFRVAESYFNFLVRAPVEWIEDHPLLGEYYNNHKEKIIKKL
ncbi:hypothetical protein [Cellvibrio zantedeschiae]|nr:hypothetical protein [Cellvibrio zantedeschiae]